MELNWQQTIGLNKEHLCSLPASTNFDKYHLVNENTLEDFINLTNQAKLDGVEISIVSSFRSFDQQMAIWNDKWKGYRPVYAKLGRPLNITKMSSIEKFKAIALWSALPGLSRHHWGTDIDIFSADAINKGYQVELTPSEFSANGICCELDYWLNKNLESFGFYRPYNTYNGGVAEEPWHISHIKTSQSILDSFDFNALRNHVNESDICEREFIVERLFDYKEKYFLNVSIPETQ